MAMMAQFCEYTKNCIDSQFYSKKYKKVFEHA